MQKDVKCKQKRRQDVRETLAKACTENPDLAKSFKSFTRGNAGRSTLEQDQPELLAAIIKIVQSKSSGDERRNSEYIRIVTTLDDLTSALRNLDTPLADLEPTSGNYIFAVLL